MLRQNAATLLHRSSLLELYTITNRRKGTGKKEKTEKLLFQKTSKDEKKFKNLHIKKNIQLSTYIFKIFLYEQTPNIWGKLGS